MLDQVIHLTGPGNILMAICLCNGSQSQTHSHMCYLGMLRTFKMQEQTACKTQNLLLEVWALIRILQFAHMLFQSVILPKEIRRLFFFLNIKQYGEVLQR